MFLTELCPLPLHFSQSNNAAWFATLCVPWYVIFVVCVCVLQTSMDQLHMHFASAIHNTAFTIVLGHVELCSGPSGSNFHKRPYPDLCKVCHRGLLHMFATCHSQVKFVVVSVDSLV